MLDEINEEIIKLLVKRRVVSTKGTIINEDSYKRVEELFSLDPENEEWKKEVASTAFVPNSQRSSFIDFCQEKGIVDEKYRPQDKEMYDNLLSEWGVESVCSSQKRKDLERFFQEQALNSLPEPVFPDDDTEILILD